MSHPPARHPAVVHELIDDEAVLLLPNTATVLVLNEVGYAIWQLLDGARTPEAIAAALADSYEVSAEQARADTLAFLEQLRSRGLLAEVP
jgi:hypothetical protein